jgi:parvulin-like peptidyl-prolyl isomerase
VVSTLTIARLRREPLVHFLLAGGALFLLSSLWDGGSEQGQQVRLDREDLLVFMQGRAQVYDQQTFAGLLKEMQPEERRQLVRDAALQEVLYREGQALSLAEADPLIRQRIVQQMRLVVMEEAAANLAVSPAEVQDFYKRNAAQYALPPRITFTHVFFAGEGASSTAQATLSRLKAEKVPLARIGEFGQRFLYQVNYSEASQRLIASHFGDRFAEAVFNLEPDSWHGPIRSEHGWHLILPVSVHRAQKPVFSDVADQVQADALAEKRQRAADGALDKLLARYEVDVEGDLDS